LLHRSQTDAAYAREGEPSNFVLVPRNPNVRLTPPTPFIIIFKASSDIQHAATDSAPPPVRKAELFRREDHITSLGFRNDGYDYTQHLKTMGDAISSSRKYII